MINASDAKNFDWEKYCKWTDESAAADWQEHLNKYVTQVWAVLNVINHWNANHNRELNELIELNRQRKNMK